MMTTPSIIGDSMWSLGLWSFLPISIVYFLGSETFSHVTSYFLITYIILILLSIIHQRYKYPLLPLKPRKESYVLLTGASSGIGLSMSHELARRGFNLILVARSTKVLEELMKELKTKHGNITVRIRSQDLGLPDAARILYEWIQSEKLQVDVLINNAGIGCVNLFLNTNATTHASMMQLNMITPTQLMEFFLPHMLKRGHGRIHFTSSMTGFVPGPHASLYCATKSYLTNLAQSVGYEVQRAIQSGQYKVTEEGVALTCICPGATITGFSAAAEAEDALIFKLPLLQSSRETVARQAVDGMIHGVSLTIPHPSYVAACWLVRFLPTQICHFIYYTLWGTWDEFRGKIKKQA